MILLILLLLSRLVLPAHKFCLIPNINYYSFMFFFKYIYIIHEPNNHFSSDKMLWLSYNFCWRWMVLDNHFRSSQLAGAIVYHFHWVTPHPSACPKIEGSGIWNGHTVAASEMSNCYLKYAVFQRTKAGKTTRKQQHVKIDNVSSDNVEVTTSTFKHNIGSDVFETNIPRWRHFKCFCL